MINKYLNITNKFHTFTKDEIYEIQKALWTNKTFIKLCKNKIDWTYEEHNKLIQILEIPKVDGYYIDKYNKRVSYNGIKTLKRTGTVLALSELHKNEIDKCRDDFKYFRKYYIKIQTRQGLQRPEPRHYQVALEDGLMSMDDCAVSFSRQSGKTITTGSYLLWRGNFHLHKLNIGIVANKPRTAREVLLKIKQMFLELPIWMMQCVETWNKADIELSDIGTRFLTDSPSGDSFRGDTISLLFCDEVAYINKSLFEEMLDSIIPTMSSLSFKQLIYTSTAKGVNHWSRIVTEAQAGVNGMHIIENDWKDVPHYDKEGNLIPPKEYKKQTIKKFGKKFFQQTEENQFLGSSDTLISGDALREIEEQVRETPSIGNNILQDLNLYHECEENHNYILSVDPSKDGIDKFAVNVTDVTCFPFIQVADADLDIDYLVMPEHLEELGKYYNNALIIVENNEGAGQSITDTLWGVYEYENLYRDNNIDGKKGKKKYTGFRTTTKSRALILNLLKVFVNEGKLIVNSETTLNQLYTFTKRKTGNKYEAEDGFFDDNVMSLAIMFAPFMYNKTFDDYELFVKELKKVESVQSTAEFLSAVDVGFSDDAEEDEQEEIRRLMLEEMELSGMSGFSTFEDVR